MSALQTPSDSFPPRHPAVPARYGVIGHPIGHSRSPWIHAAFARQTGQDLTYTAIDSPLDGFAATLDRLHLEGYGGVNVTVPFKFEAHALATTHSERATLAQAANTLMWRHTPQGSVTLHADNTDGAGLVRDITHNAALPLAGRRILVLGAGGASAGVLGALIAERPAAIVVANRSLGKADRLVVQHAQVAARHGVALTLSGLDAVTAGPTDPASPLPASFDVIVNATSTSLGGAPLRLRPACLVPGALVYDMMYGPAAAPFLDAAAGLGATVRDGLGMLVEQASEAFALWRSVRPDTGPVLAELRAMLDGELQP